MVELVYATHEKQAIRDLRHDSDSPVRILCI